MWQSIPVLDECKCWSTNDQRSKVDESNVETSIFVESSKGRFRALEA